MAKAQKTAAGKKAPHSKASRPDVHPLGEHLAALLNPALNQRAAGFAEAPGAAYEAGPASRIDAKLADALGLDDVAARAPSAPLYQPPGVIGVQATVDSLKDLLERGDPNLRAKKPWTPHRPMRPDKSEGGVPFKIT